MRIWKLATNTNADVRSRERIQHNNRIELKSATQLRNTWAIQVLVKGAGPED